MAEEQAKLQNTPGSLIDEMRKTGSMNNLEKAERLEEIVQEAAQETRLQEEEMKAQEAEDDADLRELKTKLQAAQAMPKPENKDKMIEYLTQRLESAMQAIGTCEEIISHERSNRKEMSQDLKQRNQTLKELIANEKKSLTDKVNDELDATLSMAVRERVQTQELYKATQAELQKRNTEFDELSKQQEELVAKSRAQEAQINEQQMQVADLQKQVQELTRTQQQLIEESSNAKIESQKASNERAEACAALIKLDEARIHLNRLMGPQGPLSMSERHKYLSQAASGENSQDMTINDRSGAFYTNGLAMQNVHKGNQSPNPGQHAYDQNQVSQSRDQQHPMQRPSHGRGGDDDEFWYQQTPNQTHL